MAELVARTDEDFEDLAVALIRQWQRANANAKGGGGLLGRSRHNALRRRLQRRVYRQPHFDAGALSRLAVQINAATQALDVATNHIHAHAASRQVGHLLGSREAGLEDEGEQIRITWRAADCDQSAFPGSGQHTDTIDAAPAACAANEDDIRARSAAYPANRAPGRA